MKRVLKRAKLYNQDGELLGETEDLSRAPAFACEIFRFAYRGSRITEEVALELEYSDGNTNRFEGIMTAFTLNAMVTEGPILCDCKFAWYPGY